MFYCILSSKTSNNVGVGTEVQLYVQFFLPPIIPAEIWKFCYRSDMSWFGHTLRGKNMTSRHEFSRSAQRVVVVL